MYKREEIAHLPTKIEKLPRLSALLNGPELLIKRDDQTGLAFGGNKTRKLEYLLADALSHGATKVLTTGATQSNHCRQTAAAAARCGLACTLVLVGPQPERSTSNLFLDQLLGAEIIWTEKDSRDLTLRNVYLSAEKAGEVPYLIPYGGSNALGAYAYLIAFEELETQLKDDIPDWIVFASSSGGTQAGLWLGTLLSKSKTKLMGISVDEPETILRDHIYRICEELKDALGLTLELDKNNILVNDSYLGQGYGIMHEGDREAIHLFAEEEGILLDPVYTGRAAGGMVDLIRAGFFPPEEKVLFWHTGGTPALFADRYQKEL
jgi:D-cysteine desulfhydrase family pyridoxal phosphate-dependent enzyme